MHVVLTQEEYDKLTIEPSKISLFIDSLNNELKLKNDDIKVYEQIGDKNIANDLSHEYIGMMFARSLFLKIMEG